MKIVRVAATFGRLEGAVLEPGPGLTVITGPNESGKSTWTSLLVDLLYGVETGARKREGFLPDKALYAPWSGKRMEGELLADTENGPVLIRRTTRRITSPMQQAEALDPRTGEALPWRGQEIGERLTGVSREVYLRSACIGREGPAVTGSEALEQRISGLVSGGEQERSASEVLDRLNSWKVKLDRTGTGRRQRTEAELATLEEQRQRRTQLENRLKELEEQRTQAQEATVQARQALDAWQVWQWEQLRQQRDAVAASLEAEGPVPGETQLAQLFQAEAEVQRLTRMLAEQEDQLRQRQQRLHQIAQEPVLLRYGEQTPESLWEQARRQEQQERQEQEQRRRQQGSDRNRRRGGWTALIVAVALLLAGTGAALLGASWLWLLPGAVVLAAAVGLLGTSGRTVPEEEMPEKPAESLFAEAASFQTAVERRRGAQADRDETSAAVEKTWSDLLETRQTLNQLLEQAGLPAETDRQSLTDLTDRAERHRTLLRKRDLLDGQIAVLKERLPSACPPAPDEPPAESEQALRSAWEQARQRETQLQTEQAQLTGALTQLPPGQELEARRQALEARRDAIVRRCQALDLAREALEQAQRELRLRFAPALNERAGQLMAALTDGRYREMLVSRTFAPEVRQSGEIASRTVPELSRGTGDQMYLALRLALCELTLPDRPPLLLDDALLAFDDRRMRAALELLREMGKQWQILLFTCHRRESLALAEAEDVKLITLE